MKKIIFIIIYFGKLPKYFKLWLKSVDKNDTINFLLVIDDKEKYKYPSNVKVIYSCFEKIQEKIKNKFGQNSKIKTPYKLCEYKPLYKFIFEEEVKQYDFWGYCDLDIIFGDIRKFLKNEILENYDKIYTRGHLTLFKNSEEIDNIILSKKFNSKYYTYREAISTNYVCHFDEWGGISGIFKDGNFNQYDNIDFADINIKKFNFNVLFKEKWKNENVIFVWNGGKLFMISRKHQEEILYAHFQKRKMNIEKNFNLKQEKYIIVPNKFCNAQKITDKYIKNNTKYRGPYIIYIKNRIKTVLVNIKNGAISQRIYRLKKKIKSTYIKI